MLLPQLSSRPHVSVPAVFPLLAFTMNPGLRVSLYFAAIFSVSGVHLPFWAVWLESRGLSPWQISIMLSTAIWLRLLAGPLAAHLVDKSGERRRALILLGWASLICFAAFQIADGFMALMFVGALFAMAWAPMPPLTENLSMLVANRHGVQYGRMRLWGSMSFLAAAYLAGLFLKGRSDDWIFWLILGCLISTALAGHLLPDLRLPLDRPRASAPLLRLLRDGNFRAFLTANAGLQASHAAFYTFGTLHWRSIGLSDAQIGFLWAIGVLAEVLLFAAGQRVVQVLGGVGLMWVAVGGGVLRWSLHGLLTDPTALALLQLLHAASFAAAHLGAMRLLAEGCEPSVSATAQTLYGAGNGAVLALATLLMGPLYAANLPGLGPGWIYPAMLPLMLIGGVGAWLLWRQRHAIHFAREEA